MTRAVEDVLLEIGADAVPQILVLAKADRIDDERRAELEHRHPDAVLDLGGHRRGARDARAADRGGVRAHAPGRGAADPVRRRARGSPSCTRSPAISSARTRPTACAFWPGCRRRRRALPGVRAQPPVRVTLSTDVGRLHVRRLDDRALLPTRAYPGRRRASTCTRSRRRCSRRGSARRSAPGSRSRSPTARLAWCCRARGSRPGTGSRS